MTETAPLPSLCACLCLCVRAFTPSCTSTHIDERTRCNPAVQSLSYSKIFFKYLKEWKMLIIYAIPLPSMLDVSIAVMQITCLWDAPGMLIIIAGCTNNWRNKMWWNTYKKYAYVCTLILPNERRKEKGEEFKKMGWSPLKCLCKIDFVQVVTLFSCW